MFMKISVYFLIIVMAGFAIFVSNTIPSFADGFLPFPIRLTHGPMICALEPQPDSKFPSIGKKFLDETRYAVIDWTTKLNQGMGKHLAWNLTSVSVPLSQQNSYDYSKCDITVNFLPKPDDRSLEYALAGYTIPNFELHKSRVEVYYLGIETEVKKIEWRQGYVIYYTYVYSPKYTGFLASDTQLKGTIRHEIGHALGLGHYVVPDTETDNIVHGIEDMPSIMIPIETVMGVTHFDITPLDISQMKATYGYNGFGPNSKVDYKKINIISFDKPIYSPEDKVELSIKTTELADGQTAFFTILDSNNKVIQEAVVSNENSSSFYLNPNGYRIPGKYYAEFMNSNATTYDYTSFTVSEGSVPSETKDSIPSDTESSLPSETKPLTTLNSPVTIPSWIKNNAKWWSEGSLSDDDFVKGIQYLIQNDIMKIPPTAKSGSSQQIPQWVKNTAQWWSSGQISDDEFVKGIQYLVQQGIIKI